jgi:hypothetical protein
MDFSSGFDVNHPDYCEGRDYMMMTYEERSLDTDIVEAQPGHVITGVRLRKLGGHLNLEIRVSTHLHASKFSGIRRLENMGGRGTTVLLTLHCA